MKDSDLVTIVLRLPQGTPVSVQVPASAVRPAFLSVPIFGAK